MSNISSETDLRSLLGGVRDQGQRPTCLVFALSDAHTAARGDLVELSCEYLFYQAVTIMSGTPLRGASVDAACRALKEIGQPLETDWPYIQLAAKDLPNDWGPPDDIGELFGRDSSKSSYNCDAIRLALEARVPIVAIMHLAPSFYRPDTAGIISMRPGEQPLIQAVHAVLVVGFGSIDGEPAYLIRNSWGDGWGRAGHAWITEVDLKNLLIETVQIGDDLDVSNNPLAA